MKYEVTQAGNWYVTGTIFSGYYCIESVLKIMSAFDSRVVPKLISADNKSQYIFNIKAVQRSREQKQNKTVIFTLYVYKNNERIKDIEKEYVFNIGTSYGTDIQDVFDILCERGICIRNYRLTPETPLKEFIMKARGFTIDGKIARGKGWEGKHLEKNPYDGTWIYSDNRNVLYGLKTFGDLENLEKLISKFNINGVENQINKIEE